MIVIIESGATKSDWRLISENDGSVNRIVADGMNVSTMPMESIKAILAEVCGKVRTFREKVTEVSFYTAGVLSEEMTQTLKSLFNDEFDGVVCDIQSDLIAAARAVCGNRPGIAAILGTGSNSCQYDGTRIVRHIYSGGYILGDEGSAAALGKMFISDFLKGLVPQYIADEFSSLYETGYASVVNKVYRSKGSPSGYLGSFAPFIVKHYEDPYIKGIVDDNFRAFFRRSIRQYDYNAYPIGIVGGFGYALQDIIRSVALEEGITISSFLKEPVDGLISYHREQHGL